MEAMDISRFKATCVAALARVGKTGQPILVTRFGKPVAQVSPPPKRRWLGVLRDEGTILGDLIEPASSPDDWEVLADPREVAHQPTDR